MREADITVNGTTLTEAQSMTVRVALQLMAIDLALAGKNQTRQAIFAGYLRCIGEINRMIAP